MKVKGLKFEAKRTTVNQVRLNSDKAKSLLTPDVLAQVMSPISFVTINTDRIAGKPRYFKEPLLETMSKEELIDLLGNVREEIKVKEKLEKAYKEALGQKLA